MIQFFPTFEHVATILAVDVLLFELPKHHVDARIFFKAAT
jgi:hypothetical protein